MQEDAGPSAQREEAPLHVEQVVEQELNVKKGVSKWKEWARKKAGRSAPAALGSSGDESPTSQDESPLNRPKARSGLAGFLGLKSDKPEAEAESGTAEHNETPMRKIERDMRGVIRGSSKGLVTKLGHDHVHFDVDTDKVSCHLNPKLTPPLRKTPRPHRQGGATA